MARNIGTMDDMDRALLIEYWCDIAPEDAEPPAKPPPNAVQSLKHSPLLDKVALLLEQRAQAKQTTT